MNKDTIDDVIRAGKHGKYEQVLELSSTGYGLVSAPTNLQQLNQESEPNIENEQ